MLAQSAQFYVGHIEPLQYFWHNSDASLGVQ